MTDERFDAPDLDAAEDAAMSPPAAGDAPPADAVDVAQARHAPELMAIDGVVGVARGQTAAGEEAIVVYLTDDAARERVPSAVEGIPVEAEVTGRIDAY